MGTLEIINLIFSGAFGSIMTLWKNAQEDKRNEREHYLKTIKAQQKGTKEAREFDGVPVTEQHRLIKSMKKITLWGKEYKYEKVFNDSGSYKASTGFHITRRIIALTCVFAIIVAPIILPAFYDTSVTFGYVENTTSLLPWVSDTPIIKWISVGDASKNIVINPIMNNIMISIIGMFFSNQICKR